MTNTPSPTDEDRELIEEVRFAANEMRELPKQTANEMEMLTNFSASAIAHLYDKTADRLESLLADRAKLEEALRDIACAIRLGAETDLLAWAKLADAHKHIALDALNRSTDHTT